MRNTFLFVVGIASALANVAFGQPARCSFLVTQTPAGRDIAVTRDDVRETAERLLARCEPEARAARPIDSAYFMLEVDARGVVRRVRRPEWRSPLMAYLIIPPRPALRARAWRWGACAQRALRRLRFAAGPAGPIQVYVGWQEPGPPTGVHRRSARATKAP